MPPHVFLSRTTNIAFTLNIIHGFTTYGFQFYLSLFFQAGNDSSPTTSGLQIMPTTLVIVVLAVVGDPLLSYWGKYKPTHITGFALMTLGLALYTTLGHTSPMFIWLYAQLITASGLGVIVATMLPTVQVTLLEPTTAASAGSWAFLRGTGLLFSVAIPGPVFHLRFNSLLPAISSPAARSKLANGQAYQRASAFLTRSFCPVVQAEIVDAFANAMKAMWIVFALVVSGGFVLTWWEKEHKMRRELNTAYGLLPPKREAVAAVGVSS